jgi:acetyl esterase/lipase
MLVSTVARRTKLQQFIDTQAVGESKCYFNEEVFAEDDIEVVTDSYDDGFKGKKAIDIYTSKGDARHARPAVVMVHGGSFTGGNRTTSCTAPVDYIDLEKKDKEKGTHELRECTALPKFATKLAQLGYVVFSIDYHLLMDAQGLFGGIFGQVNFIFNLLARHKNRPAILAGKDARAAVRWIKKHAGVTELNIDPTRIAMMGDSAGAITTVWANYRTSSVEETEEVITEDGVNGDVALAIPLSGLLNFKAAAGSIAPDFTESICCPESQPPLLVVAATGNETVPFEASKQMHERAQAVGLDSALITVPGSWHIPYTELMDADPDQTEFHFDTFKSFLMKSLKLEGC